MKRILLALILLAIFAPFSRATFTLVQVKSNNACSATSSCAVTVTSTGSGNMLIIGLIDNANQVITSVTGGGTYTHCSNCANGEASTGWVDMSYTLNSTSGATSITINHTSGGNNSIGVVWEVSFTAGPVAFDASASNLVIVNCTACAGTALTLTGSNDSIFTIASCGGSCTAVSAPYTNDLANPGNDTAAHRFNTGSGTAATLNQTPTAHITSTALAIKDSAGGTACTNRIALLGAGCS